jgi:hypothetical protein
MLKIYGEVCRKNIKIFLLPGVLSVFLLIAIIFIVINLRNSSAHFITLICQQFFVWSGIFLLSPVFMPEQKDNIEETVLSKAMPVKAIYIIRLTEALLTLILFTAGFIGLLILFGNEIEFKHYFIHTLGVALLLGSLGLVGTRFTGNISVGYLIAFGFYVLQMFLPLDRIEIGEYIYIFTLIVETNNIIYIYLFAFILIAVPFIKKH